ncbi:MAG: C69 family dipeptidase [Thermoproteota archaeon]
MCDTLVVIGNSTKNGETIFAKNSDREPNEPQALEFYPRMKHDEEYVKCTYVLVPQVKETYAILISRPIWMWGAEMGVNEFGLAIGNEAVFTKERNLKKGLTGMDLLRLALERCKSAKEALELIINLLEKYGQGGNCGFRSRMYYHNSFIIADPKEAYVLETAGKYWVSERVKNVRSISNALTIENKWDLASKGLIENAIEKGWCKDDKEFNFAKCYSDKLYTYFSKGRNRHKYTQKLLEKKIGEIDLNYVKSIMRSHHIEEFIPAKGSMEDICMHAGGITRPSQTTASYIGQLFKEIQVHWFTATSTPCISAYKPVFIQAGLPNLKLTPSEFYDSSSIWWIHEKMYRKMLGSFKEYFPMVKEKIDSMETYFQKRAEKLRDNLLDGKTTPKELRKLTDEAFSTSVEFERSFCNEAEARKTLNLFFELYWKKWNSEAKISF